MPIWQSLKINKSLKILNLNVDITFSIGYEILIINANFNSAIVLPPQESQFNAHQRQMYVKLWILLSFLSNFLILARTTNY